MQWRHIEEVEVYFHSFLTSKLDESKWYPPNRMSDETQSHSGPSEVETYPLSLPEKQIRYIRPPVLRLVIILMR
jgi:hypothetical protein